MTEPCSFTAPCERYLGLLADRDELQREIERLTGHIDQDIVKMAEMVEEIERLRALLRHADDVVIWEHTPARSGFQEEIESALGISDA